MKNDVYITSTLKNKWNLKFNAKLCKVLEERGLKVFLPQRNTNQKEIMSKKFYSNIKGIDNSKYLLLVAKNETPNWGAEAGYAYAINKPIIALVEKEHTIPGMVDKMISKPISVDNLNNIDSYINKLTKALK